MLKQGILYNKKHKTYPNIVHFPGIKPKTSKFWERLQKLSFYKPFELNDLTIITWNNQKEKGILEKSLDDLKIKYHVLGTDVKKWNNTIKLKLTFDFMESIKTKFVMGLDSLDVIVLNLNIIEKFQQLNCKMLFNGQEYCYPQHRYNKEVYEFVQKEQKEFQLNLNSGAWLGETKFCNSFFNECLNAKSKDKNPIEKYWNISDQIYVRTIAQQYMPNEIKIDSFSKIFQVLENEKELEII